MSMQERFSPNVEKIKRQAAGNLERHQKAFQELFRSGKWLAAIRHAVQNGVSMAHEDPEGMVPEERLSVNEAIRRIIDAQEQAKEAGDRAEFERLEEEYRGILFALFDPEFAKEEYDDTRRSFDDQYLSTHPERLHRREDEQKV